MLRPLPFMLIYLSQFGSCRGLTRFSFPHSIKARRVADGPLNLYRMKRSQTSCGRLASSHIHAIIHSLRSLCKFRVYSGDIVADSWTSWSPMQYKLSPWKRRCSGGRKIFSVCRVQCHSYKHAQSLLLFRQTYRRMGDFGFDYYPLTSVPVQDLTKLYVVHSLWRYWLFNLIDIIV